MSNVAHPAFIAGLSELAGDYPFLLCDVWGVVHNGIEAYPPAVAALERYRAGGGIVLLITNAPRPKAEVVAQITRLGVAAGAYDDVMSSGQASRDYLATRPGLRVFYVGPERDLTVVNGLDVSLVDAGEAEIIACTGPFDDNRDHPDDYLPRLRDWATRGLPMLCVNPDKVVERGDRLVWCAGALAERYAAVGGETIVIGKPHAPIYAAALDRLSALAGRPVDKAEVLAVGDGIETDLTGANRAGLDLLFVTGGIHAELFGDRAAPDIAAVHAVLAERGLAARALIPTFVW